jgi:hypothetical protein
MISEFAQFVRFGMEHTNHDILGSWRERTRNLGDHMAYHSRPDPSRRNDLAQISDADGLSIPPLQGSGYLLKVSQTHHQGDRSMVLAAVRSSLVESHSSPSSSNAWLDIRESASII